MLLLCDRPTTAEKKLKNGNDELKHIKYSVQWALADVNCSSVELYCILQQL